MTTVRRPTVLLVAAISLAPTASLAHPDGREVNRSTVGCGRVGNCHGAAPGAVATLTGPDTVLPGGRATLTLVVRSDSPTFTGGGFDVGVRGPAGTTLAATQANTRINAGDLVMNSRVAAVGGAFTVTFDVVTPAAGAVTVTAAGNATNGTGSAGDAWALAAHTLMVGTGPLPDAGADRDASIPDGDAAAVDAGGPPTVEAYDPTASYGYGGCSTSGRRATTLRWGWFAALAWWARRRREGRDG